MSASKEEQVAELNRVAASRYKRSDGRIFYRDKVPAYSFSSSLCILHKNRAIQMQEQEEVTILPFEKNRFDHHPNYWEFIGATGRWGYAHHVSFQNLPHSPEAFAAILQEESAMSTITGSVYQTSFGKFVPCDKPTYKKLKRINHLYTQFVWNKARLWDKSQARQPSNRVYRRYDPSIKKKVKVPITESILFKPFYGLHVQGGSSYTSTTILWDDFTDDIESARKLVASAEEVKPLKLSIAQIDELLVQIEEWMGANLV